MNATVRRVEVADGAELSVHLEGRGPALVLLHGFTGDASTLQSLTDRLSDDHLVITPNLVGHGGSTGPRDRYGVDAMVDQVLDALTALGIPAPYDMVGYSMGGRVALTMACREPATVASLSLIGASAGLATAEERAERVDADEELAASIVTDGLEPFVDRWMANPLFATQSRLGEEFLAHARAQRLGNDAEELARSLRGAGTGSMRPLHDDLPGCPMPVALIVGADDAKFRAIAEDLSETLPDARVTTVADAGHAAHLEQPDAVVDSILATVVRGAVRAHPMSLPMRGAHTTGRGTASRRDSLLLGLRAGGHTGWGEASPLPGWSDDDLAAVAREVPDRLPLETTVTAWEAIAGWLAPGGRSASARSAVTGAALDLDARRQGTPLWRYLADWHPALEVGQAIDRLALNALVSSPDPVVVGDEVRAHAAAGFTTVKLKVGAVDPDTDRARLTAARVAAPDVDLRLDANGAWDHETALAVLAHAASLGAVLCEEPVRGVEGIAEVGRRTTVPVAVDESVRSAADLAAVGDHVDAIAALVVKPQALGGSDRAIDTIIGARRLGLDVIVTSMIDSSVGLAHAAHVAAACGLESAHGLATAEMLQVDVARGLEVVDGAMVMPTGPGLGVGPVSPVVIPPS